MRLSVYTFVKDGLYYDFHVVAMLRHHLPLADEIIVNEGFSSDGTYEAIRDLDPKIKVHRFQWDRSDPNTWHIKFKDQARRLCTGDWCILLDCDEFIPEWEFDRLRKDLASTDKSILPVRFVHFYGNYKVYAARSAKHKWPRYSHRIHRNLESIEVWGDGANVCVRGEDKAINPNGAFECHHFGEVRNPARLRQKWRMQAKLHDSKSPKWDKTPGFLFNLFPHKWEDEEFFSDLAIHPGPYVQAVRENPEEFVRDGWALIESIKKRDQGNKNAT
jgi:glycosyltransferase involved in cell wall biosynthesis